MSGTVQVLPIKNQRLQVQLCRLCTAQFQRKQNENSIPKKYKVEALLQIFTWPILLSPSGSSSKVIFKATASLTLLLNFSIITPSPLMVDSPYSASLQLLSPCHKHHNFIYVFYLLFAFLNIEQSIILLEILVCFILYCFARV